eukprot:GGOE01055442.1.p1 GENE.GGOE01055442.1~~GGOE01055442.1.p1  ORF type:complete len:373 (-),score=101.09 GGOE01055442.1:131-1249(-)
MYRSSGFSFRAVASCPTSWAISSPVPRYTAQCSLRWHLPCPPSLNVNKSPTCSSATLILPCTFSVGGARPNPRAVLTPARPRKMEGYFSVMSGGAPPFERVVVKLEGSTPQSGAAVDQRRRFFPKAVKRPEGLQTHTQPAATPSVGGAAEGTGAGEDDFIKNARRERQQTAREWKPRDQLAFEASGGAGGLAPVLQGSRGATSIVQSKGPEEEDAAPPLHALREQTRNFPTSLPIGVNQADPSGHLDEESTACFIDSGSEELKEDTLFLIQLPLLLPLPVDPKVNRQENKTTLTGLPSGQSGKMVVYKSGKIKLQLGNCMMDVSLAKSGTFAQSLMAINPTDDCCYFLGDVSHTMVVSPCLTDLPKPTTEQT